MAQETPWSAVPFPSGAHAGSREPALALVGETVHMVWNQCGVLQHAYRENGGWSQPVRVACGARPVLAATPDSRLHCLFVNEFLGHSEVYHTTWDGSRWSSPENLSHSVGASTQPALVAGPDGVLHAAWSDTTAAQSTLYYAQRGQLFWSCERLPEASGQAPALGIAGEGAVYLVWQNRFADGEAFDIFAALQRHGTWTPPVNLSDTPHDSVAPALTVGSGGRCHVVWQEATDNNTFQIMCCQGQEEAWLRPVLLSSGTLDCRQPHIVAGTRGETEAVWLQGTTLCHRSLASQAGTPWGEIESVTTSSPAAVGELALATGFDEQLHAAWSALNADGDWRIGYARREAVVKRKFNLPIL